MLNDPELPGIPEAPRTFMSELQTLLNRYSQEKYSSTPDFVLAKYVVGVLRTFDAAVLDREAWYGRQPPAATRRLTRITREPVVPAMTEDADRTVVCSTCDAEVSPEDWPAHRCSG